MGVLRRAKNRYNNSRSGVVNLYHGFEVSTKKNSKNNYLTKFLVSCLYGEFFRLRQRFNFFLRFDSFTRVGFIKKFRLKFPLSNLLVGDDLKCRILKSKKSRIRKQQGAKKNTRQNPKTTKKRYIGFLGIRDQKIQILPSITVNNMYNWTSITGGLWKRGSLLLALHKFRVRKFGVLKEAEFLSRFTIQAIKLLLLFPSLRGYVLRRYPKLFGGLLFNLSQDLKFLLLKNNNLEFLRSKPSIFNKRSYFVSTQKPKVSLIPFGLSIVRSRVPRSFKFFFSKLKERYGFNDLEVYLRLDKSADNQIHKGKINENDPREVSLYLLRRKIRRWYGHLTPHHLWRIRRQARLRIGGFKSKPYIGFFEFRLDVFLVRAHLALTIYHSRGMLVAGVIMVNGQVRTNYTYIVGSGDTVTIVASWTKFFQVRQICELHRSLQYPTVSLYRVFPLYLEANYRTMSFRYLQNKFSNVRIPFLFNFKVTYALNCGRFIF